MQFLYLCLVEVKNELGYGVGVQEKSLKECFGKGQLSLFREVGLEVFIFYFFV